MDHGTQVVWHDQQFTILTPVEPDTLVIQSNVQPLVVCVHTDQVTVGVTLSKF